MLQRRRLLLNWQLGELLALLLVAMTGLALGQDPDPTTDDGKPSRAQVMLRGLVLDEDGRGVEDALVETQPRSADDPTFSTRTLKGGLFRLTIEVDGHYGLPLLITDASKQKAAWISQFSYTTANPTPLKVIVKPWRHSTVAVVDSHGQPLADAAVRLIIDYGGYQSAVTNQAGEAAFRVPVDATVNWILAYKDDVGLDYYVNSELPLPEAPIALPEQVLLRLTGANPASVKVVDGAGQPLAGVEISPWIIETEGKRSDINLSGLSFARTDDDGVAHFRFLPHDQVGSVSFLLRSEHLHCPDQPRLLAGAVGADRELVAKVWKTVIVRGKVVHQDGTPAAGIRLQGEGRGETNDYFRGHTTTQADGSYEMEIYPDQVTMIAVTDERYGAKSIELPSTKEGEVIVDVDLKLNEGFTVSGQLTYGAENQPAIDETATLIQMGDNGVELVRWSQPNKSGLYSFRVGPGTYKLSLLDSTEPQVIDVTDRDLVFNRHVDRLARGTLTGRVIDEQGEGVAALVIGESIDAAFHVGFTAESSDDGAFSTDKWNDTIRSIALSAEKRLFGTMEIGPDTHELEVVVRPAASLRCRVVAASGQPIPKCSITAVCRWEGVAVPIRGHTDAGGYYTFGAVGVGEEWIITAQHSSGIREVKFTPEEAKEYRLPVLQLRGQENVVP